MKTNLGDARLHELRLLTKLERQWFEIRPMNLEQSEKDMIAFLIHEGYVNGLGSEGWSWRDDFGNWSKVKPEANELLHQIEYQRWNSLNRLLGGSHLNLSISHKGRVRLAELRQALRTGRDHDPSSILFDQRHVKQGVAMAILDAADDSPVALAFLDLNGLKAINDSLGHAKGNEVIEIFFQTVSGNIEGRAEAYRNGGDEVVVIAPGMTAEVAKKMLVRLLVQLGKELVDGVLAPITASCGVVTTMDPGDDAEELLGRADQVMYRAKEASKKRDPRVSTLAIEDCPVDVIAR